MRYRINQIRINPYNVAGEGGGISRKFLDEELASAVRKFTGKPVKNIEIVRESIDARKGHDVKLVYTLDFDCDAKLPYERAQKKEYICPVPEIGTRGRKRPIVVGFGPCGIFAALVLAEAGLNPIVIERGKTVDERVADVEQFWASAGSCGSKPNPESNVQFGEGGAGTFSDGKLTTGIRDARIKKVLDEFVKAGAPAEILYKQKPHIGTDKLRGIIKNIRLHIENLGGDIRFSTKLEGIEFAKKNETCIELKAIKTSQGRIETDYLILAIGHSARDTFKMLYEAGFKMEQKPFSIGVRMEHLQEKINEVQYGDKKLANILGPAEYKINCKSEASGRGVYTFCMCPGGTVINASTEVNTSVTNGMSYSNRAGKYANSALLVDVRASDFETDHPLAGVDFQKKYETLAWENRTHMGMAITTYDSFKKHQEDAVRRSLPAFAVEAILDVMPKLGKKLAGFDDGNSKMIAVESRSSSPVRILRKENMQTPGIRGVIPAGEGAGYAGGIMSAAVDGIRAAEQIIMLK